MDATTVKPSTEPAPDLTVRQAAQALYGDDGKTAVKRVQRLILSGELAATKLPGETGAYLIQPPTLRDFQQKHQRQLDKKRR